MRWFWTYGMVFCLLGLSTGALMAATATNGGMRNVITTDGIVATGGVPYTNGVLWETDEVLSGADGVDWFVTWDDTNLYLGRIGGDNAVGSVIYLHAAYSGATFANRGFNYDQLEPEVSAMGGVNFAAYFTASTHELRTYNGAWSSAVAPLSPQFTTQINGDNFEVTIPWVAISAGNGRPTSLRFVLYQVAAGQPGCPQELVSAASPWGTGNVGDGPAVAVNNGVALSAPQPNGCDQGDSAATRWWGCYPVNTDLGPNNWPYPLPDAGPDDSICATATAYFMQGNAAIDQALSLWTVVAQPSGSPAVTFLNPNSPQALAQNLVTLGTYTFVWQYDCGDCPVPPDTVMITRIAAAPTAVTMPDATLLCNGDSTLLQANGPGNGNGLWSLVSGAGTIASPTDSTTTVTGLNDGHNLFQYTIDNRACPVTRDTVDVYVPIPIFADAGPDQSHCATTVLAMNGNEPDSIQLSAQGLWTMLSGPSAAYFADPYVATTNVSFLVPGVYEMIWTVANASCPVMKDTMRIYNYEQPIADAGGDQTLCIGADALLAANDLSGLGSAVNMWWSQSAGPSVAIFSDTSIPNPIVQNLVSGEYTFTWSAINGACPVDSDTILVTVIDLVANGILNEVLPDSGMSNGSILLSPPLNGDPPYLYSNDGINFVGSALFDSLAAGLQTFYFLDANGCADNFNHALGYLPPEDTVELPGSVKAPTGFSPNGDGVNDTWEIPGIEDYPTAVVEVFNNWGGLVYRSAGVYQPWNGQRNGQDLPTAVYYFVIDLHAEGQSPVQGSLTILR